MLSVVNMFLTLPSIKVGSHEQLQLEMYSIQISLGVLLMALSDGLLHIVIINPAHRHFIPYFSYTLLFSNGHLQNFLLSFDAWSSETHLLDVGSMQIFVFYALFTNVGNYS